MRDAHASMGNSCKRLWRVLFIGGCCLLLEGQGCRPHPAAPLRLSTTVTLAPDDRVLILAPHPDDEVLGCGGIIQQAVAMGLPVRVVFLTYGDNNEWSFLLYRKHPVLRPSSVQRMGQVRHDEALAAAKILGLSADQLIFLGYPDFGTMSMWKDHWGDRPPFHSMLTRVRAVPYANALRPGAAYKGEEVVRDLTTVLADFRPTKVFVSHPADHMPDHSALYLFTRVALWDLEAELQSALYPYLVHFKRWPASRGDLRATPLEPPRVLQTQVAWAQHVLTPEEVARKRAAIVAHRTQYGSSARYLTSFIRPNELFGDFPMIALRSSQALQPISPDRTVPAEEPSEELTDQERAAFVGVEERSAALDGETLVLSIAFSRPLAAAVEASVYVFGYRTDRPFADMPKLHIKLGALTHAIADQDRPLPQDSCGISRHLRRITLRVPLRLLGDPQRILTSARTYLGEVPLDMVSWRVLEMETSDVHHGDRR